MSGIQDCDNEVIIEGDVIVSEITGTVEITNDEGSPIPVTVTPAAPVERTLDGDIQVGAGTIVIPDGVRSFAVSVLAGGDDVNSLADWVTIETPEFAAPVPLRNGQSVSHAADESNTLSGPITVTVPAGGAANATWVEA